MQKAQALNDLPIIGDAAAYERDRLQYLVDSARIHGEIFRYNEEVFFLTEPDLIEQVMVRTQRDFIMPEISFLRSSNNLSSEENIASWRNRRRGPANALHQQNVHMYVQRIVDISEQGMSQWFSGKDLVVLLEMKMILAHTIFFYFFGDDGNKLIKPTYTFIDAFFKLMDSPFALPSWIPTPNIATMRASHTRLKQTLQQFINERRTNSVETADLLGILLSTTNRQNEPLAPSLICGMLISMLIASSYPLINALAWVYLLLAQYPAVQEKLNKEVIEVIGMRQPTSDDLPHLRYVEAVIKETLRLYPPIWQLPREVIHDCELNGYICQKGQMLHLSPYIVQRDPRFYAQPDTFLPERWLDEAATKSLPKYSYFPFGGGPRICLGSPLAMTELTLITALVGRRFHIGLSKKAHVKISPLTLLTPQNLIVKLTTRE